MQQLLSDCADSGKFYNAGEKDKRNAWRNVALLRFSRRLVVYTTWQRAFIYFSHYVCSTWFGNKKNHTWCGRTNSAAAAAALVFYFIRVSFMLHSCINSMNRRRGLTRRLLPISKAFWLLPHIAGWCSALYSRLQSQWDGFYPLCAALVDTVCSTPSMP